MRPASLPEDRADLPDEQPSSLDDIWRPEELAPARVTRPRAVGEDIWGQRSSPAAALFALPRTWRASAPPRRHLWAWVGFAGLAAIAVAAMVLLLR